MACIITNGNTSLSTTNGFNLVESFNNAGIGAVVTLASEKIVNLQFTSASANALGVVLTLYFSAAGATAPASSTYYDILAELQENTSYPSGNNWVTRASKQMSTAECTNNVANLSSDGWIVPFTFTTPYAIDNAAPSGAYYKWRLRVTRAGTGTNIPNLRTSNGTVPAYWLWGSTPRTFADNDQVIAKDILTIDKTGTMLGTLGTGETTFAPALVICKSANPTVANVGNVVWENTPAASYTLTFDGTVYFGAHSGMRVGSAASPIPINKQAIISFPNSTNGSATGFKYIGPNYNAGRKASFFFYGEYPAVWQTTLAATSYYGSVTCSAATDEVTWTNHGLSDGQPVYFVAATTQPTGLVAGQIYYARVSDTAVPASRMFLYDTAEHALAGGATGKFDFVDAGSSVRASTAIVTTDTTGWSVGDKIAIGGSQAYVADAYTVFEIATISGNLITTTVCPNYTRLSSLVGHPVIKMSGCGIKIVGNVDKDPLMDFNSPSNLVMIGVEKANMGSIKQGSNASTAYSNMPWDDLANTSKHIISYCAFSSTSGGLGSILYACEGPIYGVEVSHNNVCGASSTYILSVGAVSLASAQRSGDVLFDNNIVLSSGPIISLVTSGMSVFGCTISNSIFEGYAQTNQYNPWVTLFGSNFVLNNNKFYGNQSLGGGLRFLTALNVTGSGNTFDNNTVGVFFDVGAEANIQLTDSVFGGEVANTYDYSCMEGALIGYQENSPAGTVTFDTTNLAACPAGSLAKVRNYNNTAGDIRSWQPEGTTESASGKLLGKTFTAGVPLISNWRCTSDAISGQSCAVKVNAQIANAAYYAGTNTPPTLRVAYDATEATDEGVDSTAAQALLVQFSPTIDNGNILVTLEQETDAATADSGVTWDSLSFLQRRYGKSENSYTKTITEVTSDVVFNWAVLLDDLFITEATKTTVDAYTGIAINDSTETITITGNHTVEELYDYCWAHLADNMDVTKFFYTIDGTNYTCIYDIVVDGATLSGAGKRLNMATNTFTLANGGATSATITDVNGTLTSLTITGLVAGLEVRMFDASDDSEMTGGTDGSSGTSHTFNYTHTIDTEVYIVVLGTAYEAIRITGVTLTAAAQSIPVSLRTDRVYQNP